MHEYSDPSSDSFKKNIVTKTGWLRKVSTAVEYGPLLVIAQIVLRMKHKCVFHGKIILTIIFSFQCHCFVTVWSQNLNQMLAYKLKKYIL